MNQRQSYLPIVPVMMMVLLLLPLLGTTWNGGVADAFLPQPSTQRALISTHHHHAPRASVSALYMVSQKEKRRRQEEQERIAALERAEVQQQQRLLAAQLKELNEGGSKNPSSACSKLLKHTAHDYGLEDIGWEAQRLALEIFQRANRPKDAAALLLKQTDEGSSMEEEQERELNQWGLWAHATLEDWSSAVRYANLLYSGSSSSEGETQPPEDDQLRQWAIQTWAHTDQNLDMARTLFRPQSDPPIVTNSLLTCYLRKRELKDARALCELAGDSSMNEESYRLLMESGDISFIELATDHRGESVLTPSDSLLVLQALIHAAQTSPEPLSPKYQALTVTALQAIVADNRKGKKKTKKTGKILELDMVSQLLVAIDQPKELRAAFQAFQNSFPKNWVLSLKPAAKARILPVLYPFDQEDAWELVKSLFYRKTEKKVPLFLREQTKEFCATALLLAVRRWDNPEVLTLARLIVKEKWKALLARPNDEFEDLLYDQKLTVTSVLSTLPYLGTPKTTGIDKVELFEKVVTVLTDQVNQLVSTSVPSPSKQQQEGVLSTSASTNTEDSLQQAISNNPKLDSIVGSFLRLLHAIVAADSVFSKDPDSYVVERMDCRYLAARASETAMKLVAESDEAHYFSSALALDAFRGTKSEDGNVQSRDVIQTIMKELLQTNLLSDDDLVEPAAAYYYSLALVSHLWSIDDQKSLLFPSPLLESLDSTTDPFKTFRVCVMGGERKEAPRRSVDKLITWIEDVVGDADRELENLLPSILQMALISDSQTGSSYFGWFVQTYRRFLLEETDLIVNTNLVLQLCDALSLVKDINNAVNLSLGSIAVEVVPNVLWYESLWDVDFAKSLIETFASCEATKYFLDTKICALDLEEQIDLSCKYLANMYAVAGSFSKLLDENGDSLGDAFMNACRTNCRYIVLHFIAGKVTTGSFKKSKARPKQREKVHIWEKFLKRWEKATVTMLQAISDHAIDDGEFCLQEYSTFGDGSSSLELLIEDISYRLVKPLPQDFIDKNSDWIRSKLEDNDLHPKVAAIVKAWCDENLNAVQET